VTHHEELDQVSARRLSRASGEDAGGPATLRARLRGERGQGVVEFAMVLPLLGALVLIFIQFGKAINYWIDLTHVSNEAARIATVNAPGVADFKSTVCDELETSELKNGSNAVDPATVTVTYPAGGSREAGQPIKVTVQTVYHWLPFWNAGSWSIGGSATMRLEHSTTDNPVLAAAAASGSCS
jgi:Flp pilus assembly protein TadG